MIRACLDRLYLLSGIAAGGFLVLIFILMMAMSLGREVGVNVPAGDDIVSWCMVALAFLGLAHTFKRGEMIRVGLLMERLTGRTRQVSELLALTIAFAFIVYFAWHAVQLTWFSWRFDDMAQGVLAVPLWIPQLGYCSGLIILAIAILDEIVIVARGNRPSYEKEKAATPDEFVDRVASGENG
jgi:TRAP-type C4-dicarboxylate transport system permease small subunit